MNLYLITQNINTGYGVYTAAIVAANSIEEAKLIYPDNNYNAFWDGDNWRTEAFGGLFEDADYGGTILSRAWAHIKDLNVVHIGIANQKINHGLILGSNTGE